MTMTTVATENPKLKVPLAMKLLARALDPAALDGEAATSATMFVRVCRREGIGLPELMTALAPVRYVERETIEPEPEPAACRIAMPFGKYAGMTLGEISEECPSYVTWAAEHLHTRPDLRCACAIVAEWYGLAEVAA
jgi:hypothetical protein